MPPSGRRLVCVSPLQLTLYICEERLRLAKKKGFWVQRRRLSMRLLRLADDLSGLMKDEKMRDRLPLSAGIEAQISPSDDSTSVSAKAQRASHVVSYVLKKMRWSWMVRRMPQMQVLFRLKI